MSYIKQIDFAKKYSVSRQAVSKRIKDEIIPNDALEKRGPSLYIDENHPDVKAYIQSLQERGYGKKITENKQSGQSKSKKKQANNDDSYSTIRVKKNQEYEISDDIKKLVDTNQLTLDIILKLPKVAIEKIEKYESYKTKKLKNEQEKKKLVSRELVDKFMDKIKTIDKNYILSLEDRIVDDLACIFGNTKPEKIQEARKRIHDEAVKILNYRAKELEKFVKVMGKKIK